jgi:hypothetical protein
LPQKYASSDLAGFAHGNFAFFVGGYNTTYGFRGTVYAIDVVASLQPGNNNNKTLVIVDKAPLRVARGDLSATVNDDKTYAIVTGGFGTTHQFCAPLTDVERYHFETDSWELIAPLNRGRSDAALVELNGNILTMGGERQLPNICVIDTPAPGEATLAIDDVEYLDVGNSSSAANTTSNTTWVRLQDLPKSRFRFAAVALDSHNAVYTFGGQVDYNSSCQCYRTTNQVIIYDASEVAHTASASSAAGSRLQPMTGLVGVAIVLVAGLLI